MCAHTIGVTLLITCIALIVVESCDYPTFKNTSITTVGVRGVDFVSGCLEPDGILEKASYVQITNQSVPVLYKGAIRNLPNLVDVVLDSNGIIEINMEAFQNLPKLRLLRIKDNKLEVIKVGVFNHLPLSELNLVNNSISVIEPGAFSDMPALGLLSLDHNKIAHWNAEWFTNSPEITALSFKNNRLRTIPSGAFVHVKGLHVISGRNVTTNIYLDENEIESIDKDAFKGLEMLGWLFLTKNRLQEIDPQLLAPLISVDWIKLGYNKLTCVPDEVIQKVPTIGNYLDGNPLTDECKLKLNKKL